jgi:hypothetical protein
MDGQTDGRIRMDCAQFACVACLRNRSFIHFVRFMHACVRVCVRTSVRACMCAWVRSSSELHSSFTRELQARRARMHAYIACEKQRAEQAGMQAGKACAQRKPEYRTAVQRWRSEREAEKNERERRKKGREAGARAWSYCCSVDIKCISGGGGKCAVSQPVWQAGRQAVVRSGAGEPAEVVGMYVQGA